MEQRAVWGLGVPQDSAFSVSTNVFVQRTPFGIYLYRANNLQLIRFLPEGLEFFLSPAGDLLFTRLPDGSIQVIDLPTGEERYVFPPIAVLSPWMKDDVYAQPPAERAAREAIFFNQVSTIRALAINPDNTLVAIGFGDASIGLWNLSNGALVSELKNDIVQDVSGLVFSPKGEKLLSSGNNGVIAVWQVDNGQLLWRLPHIGHIIGQPFSLDGSLMALEITQETSSWVSVRETRYGDELAPQVVGVVASQAISPDNTRLLTTWYGTVKIWLIPNLVYLTKIETGLDWPRASYSTDGKYILINDGEQAYLASDFSRDEAYQAPKIQPTPEVNSVALQQMGHLSGVLGLRYPLPEQAFAWGTFSDHEAWVLDLANNIQTIYDFGSPFMAEPDLSFSGDRLAACTDDGLLLITLADGQTNNLGKCRASAVVRFSADGNSIFRGDGILIDALNSKTGELLYNLRGQSFLVEDFAVTSDGLYLVSSSNFQRTQGREVIWWRLEDPKQLRRWMESVYQSDYLYAAEFQPANNVLYTALGGLRSRRLGDGQPDHLDTNEIASLALLPESNLLATGDMNGVIHIWSLENWQELVTLSDHRQRISGLVFSPDGSSLLSISMDGTIRLWGLP
jgi:WD40 repeat protein